MELAADSPELRLELTIDDEPLVYCVECWQRESGGYVSWEAVASSVLVPGETTLAIAAAKQPARAAWGVGSAL